MSAREPRTVILLLTLAVLGHGARLLMGRSGAPPGEVLATVSAGPEPDPALQRARAARAGRPLTQGEVVDLNSAPAEEITRLPRIGMSLAKRIVSDRIARGPFRGLADLDRVPGVGPALLGLLKDRVHFGGVGVGTLSEAEAANLRTSGAYAAGQEQPAGTLVDLNLASEADLLALPRIGSARARAILAYRREAGPFAVVSELSRVPGFSRSLVARLAPYLTVR
jgi:competence ComEA-like helix-hairpin-helix protein